MESTVVGIASVESKDINTKKGPSTLFVVKDAVGTEYSTFDRELAVQAAALRGQNATIGFDISTQVKPNRQGVDTTYTNRYLKTLGVVGALSAPVQSEQTFDSAPVPVAPVPVQAVTAPPTATPVSTPVIQPQQSHSDREESIARAVALKAAVELAAGGVSDASVDSITVNARYFESYLLGRDEPAQEPVQALPDDEIPF